MAAKALEITVRNMPKNTWELRLGNTAFASVAAMKEHILTLPKGTRLEIQNECCVMPGQPLFGDPSELNELEAWCKTNNISLTIHPSG